jgi:glyoxylase-like metal-dependent hydrolase (beta-lactamase superfamily II)
MTHPVAQQWFHRRSFSDGVTMLWEPHAHPSTRCNIWHIAGRDRDLLFDTGMGVMPLAPEIAKLSGRPVLCFGSHSHFDHVGGHHEFPERLMHAAEAEIMARPDRDNMIIEGWVRTDTFDALPYRDFAPERYTVQAAPITRPVDDGDVIDLGDRVFEVLHLPGHSPGSCGVLERATGLFFSGDVILDGKLLDDLYHSVPEDFVESMERIRELPVTTVHAGHHKSFGRDRMCEIAEDYIKGRRRAGCPAEHGS